MENNNTPTIKGFGLTKLPSDKRDFALTKLGAMLELPEEDFVVAEPLIIFDQKDSDMCVAFAAVAVSQDQEGVILSPEYLFAKGKQLKGDWLSWGLDLRTIAKALCRFGSIERKDAPYQI